MALGAWAVLGPAGLAYGQGKWPLYKWPTEPVVPSEAPLADRQVIRLYAPQKAADPRSSLETPGMEVFLPKGASAGNKPILLVPGGSYHHITASKLFTMAEALREQGAPVFVLFYRYGKEHPCPAPLEDGMRAVRIVRAYAGAWGLDGKQITMIGTSAGGHLAGWVAARGGPGNAKAADVVERVSARPDRVALISPVVSMREDWAGTRGNTLPAGADVGAFGKTYSVDLLVDKNTPPVFLWHALDDSAVKVAGNSDRLSAALEKAGVHKTYVRADKGGHVGAWNEVWGKPLVTWLRNEGVLPTAPATTRGAGRS